MRTGEELGEIKNSYSLKDVFINTHQLVLNLKIQGFDLVNKGAPSSRASLAWTAKSPSDALLIG